MVDFEEKADTENISFPLRRLLKERGITQLELARRTGIQATYISRLVSGKTEPRWKTVLTIADALDLDLGDLSHDCR